ncbi:hypothetical protein GCM10020218_082310 [Dactylosporangium vinaceum]|uniref:Methyltransferase n=1 Tax=Dactylosporangium vinaceum TaxID=53362 RepID=A0ABV5MEF9_9ACTN|nr:methyltransferase [Dactylosporangium vinaceum]
MPTKDQTLVTLREAHLGPMRFMNILSVFELGIVDLMRKQPNQRFTAEQLGAAVGATPDAIYQLLLLPVKDGLIALDERTGEYTLDGLARLGDEDFARVLPWMNMIKVVCLRQLYYLTDSIRAGEVVGLQKLFGLTGTFYEATLGNDELRSAWGSMMDAVTEFIDPWFFDNVEVGAGQKVLDLAGNTGLGAILTYRHKGVDNLHVTCFDFPEKEAEALANFEAAGLAGHCSFIGGDVFKGVPKGFDLVLIKHFLDMFDRDNVLRILRAVAGALEPGGQVYILVPIYPEEIRESSSVDFFPSYFLGCTMAQGGPQKVSTYSAWLEEAGFEVTRAITQDHATMPADMVPVHGIICGTRKA